MRGQSLSALRLSQWRLSGAGLLVPDSLASLRGGSTSCLTQSVSLPGDLSRQ